MEAGMTVVKDEATEVSSTIISKESSTSTVQNDEMNLLTSIHRLFQMDLWSSNVACVAAAMKHIADSCSARKRGKQAVATRQWMAQEPQRLNTLAMAMKRHASNPQVQALGCMVVHNSTTNPKRNVHHPAITTLIEGTKHTCILQAVASALKDHTSHRSVQICALGALSRLLQVREHLHTFLSDSSSAHIRNAMKKYPDVPGIQRWGKVCLHCLNENPGKH